MFLQNLPEGGQLGWLNAYLVPIKDILLLLAATKFIFDYFQTRRKRRLEEQHLTAATDNLSNLTAHNSLTVPSKLLQEWMDRSTIAGDKILAQNETILRQDAELAEIKSTVIEFFNRLLESSVTSREALVKKLINFRREFEGKYRKGKADEK